MSEPSGTGSGGAVAARLRAELARLRVADPFQVLGVPITAERETVRNAFLVATKRRHPNRFAREVAEVRELATEVFLVIRAAYEQLLDDAKRASWRTRLAPAAPVRPTVPPPEAPVSPPAETARTPTTRPPEGRMPTTRPPEGRIPTTRPPAAAAPAAPRRPTAPPPGNAAIGTRPPQRPSGQDVQALLDAAKTRGKRFDDAVAAIAEGRYQQAREALFQLVSEDPKNRRYRTQLHLAWGLEHRLANRGDEAIRELQRAVALDPECTEAANALAKLQEQRKSGLFARLFGR